MHALQPRDPASTVHFCSWFLQSVVKGEIDPQLAFFSDEAWFHLQGYINTQNNRYWNSQNPHLTLEVKVGICCAVNARSIARCAVFNETINCERYVEVILGQFFSEITEEERLCGRFQQDSSTALTERMSIQTLSDVFGERIASSDIGPARSPVLILGIFSSGVV
jgi:hypothetical protein